MTRALGRWFGRQLVLTGTVVAVVVVVLVLVIRGHLPASAPFSLSAMHAHAEVTVTKAGGASRLLETLTDGRVTTAALLHPIRQREHLVFQVHYRTGGRRSDDGQLAMFVIDNRLHKPLSNVYVFGPPGSNVGQGWDGRYERLAHKYRWLASLAAVQDDSGGYTDPGMAVGWPPGTAGPLTIDAVLDPDALPVTDPSTDVTVVLAYLGDSRGAWAVRVPVVTAG